ncbi:hypothetical protein IV203_010755 [Nitzschia inconspicua]|uniref:Uncharacterized protein n=1 Tax=Nitzschia inconspicua TaxID=303405 RepID=A0A9K3KWQ1_9STRA|nr:hypothetical protein IV203_010755 [Nitzschia inconspicua]
MAPTSSGKKLRQADKASRELKNKQSTSRYFSDTPRNRHESFSSKRSSSVRSKRAQNQEKGCKKPQKPTRQLNDIKIGETEAMNESEISLALPDLQISSNPSIRNAPSITKNTKSLVGKGVVRRRKRGLLTVSGDSSVLSSHPTHDNSVGPANIFKAHDKERSQSRGLN